MLLLLPRGCGLVTELFVCVCMGRGERGRLGVGRGGFMDLLEMK